MDRNILYVASTHSHLMNFHLPYLRRFREAGWTVHAACGGADLPVPGADRVIALPFAKRITALENFAAARMLGRLMGEEQYDLVVTNTALAAFFTRLPLVGRRARPKVVNIAHGYLFGEEGLGAREKLLLAAERLTAGCTDLVLVMNETDRQIAERYRLGARVDFIPGMGVDFARLDAVTAEAGARLRARESIPPDAFLMVYPAEFSRRKNQELLIRALAELPPRVWLILPGAGTELERCRALALQMGVASRMRFPGHVPDVATWLRAADCAVSASRSEGLPFNIMEAMGAGLPILASDVKGHRDLLGGGAGVLYPEGDEKAFVAAAALLAEDAEYRAKLGRAALVASAQYGLSQVFAKVLAALEPELLEPEAERVEV